MALPTEIHPFAIAGGGNQYQVANSLRFRASNSAYLLRSFPSAGNRKTWTFSAWVKRSLLTSGVQTIFGSYASSSDVTALALDWHFTDGLHIAGWSTNYRISTPLFRDPSAWYHVVWAFDTTQATASNRSRIYVNGVEITAYSTNNAFAQNTDYGINQAGNHSIGVYHPAATTGYQYFDGYMAEINFVDGFQYDPSYFGQTDSVTGIWGPKKYTGTYGTNGFYLPFNDATSTTTIGYDRQLGMADSSKNNWTASGISVTSGVTYDSMIDSPTNYDDGGRGRGNYAVLNPIDTNSSSTVSNGNLQQTCTVGPSRSNATFRVPASGKWYCEFINSAATNANRGIGFGVSAESVANNGDSAAVNSYHFYASTAGYIANNGTATLISSWTNSADQTFHLAIDADNGKVWIGQNNVWWNSTGGSTGDPSTGANPTFSISPIGFKIFSYIDSTTSFNWTANFGQRPFAYTPPSGFKALNTYNLPNPSLPLV